MSILLIILIVNASIGFYEVNKASDAVEALKNTLKPMAHVKRDGKYIKIDTALLVPNDCISLANGSAIPADCRVNEGVIEIDQSTLTGESFPVVMNKGDSCKWGSTVVRGEVEATVEYTGSNTFLGNMATLLNNDKDDHKTPLEKLLLKIMLILVGVSSVLCTIVFIFLASEHSVHEGK